MDLVNACEEHLLKFLEEESLKALAHLRSKGCSQAESEDILSDLALDFLLKIRAQRPFLNRSDDSDFCRYAWAALRNQGLSWRRKCAKGPVHETIDGYDPQDVDSPWDLWDFWCRFPDAVEKAVLELSPKLRAVAILNFCGPQEELPTRSECARILGVSEETVKKRLLRARSQLKERLKHAHQEWLDLKESS